jgi:hypothetical protein
LTAHSNNKTTAQKLTPSVYFCNVAVTSSTSYQDLYQSLRQQAAAKVGDAVKAGDITGQIQLVSWGGEYAITPENWASETQPFCRAGAMLEFDFHYVGSNDRKESVPMPGLLQRVCNAMKSNHGSRQTFMVCGLLPDVT